MRTQFEKNKETLMEEIEKYSEQPMTNALAEKLNVYHGALKALCMAERGWGEEDVMSEYASRTADKPEPTMELDGDTEFERVIMTIPADAAHMVKITHIFNKHMEGLAAVNRRAYNSIIEQLKEVAKS